MAGKVPAEMMLTLSGAGQRSYEDAPRTEEREDGGRRESKTVGKVFKPTISDLKLLIGTREWAEI